MTRRYHLLFLITVLAFSAAGLHAQQLEIGGSSPPYAIRGQGYGLMLSASGGSPPYGWSVSGLPPGLNAEPSGMISGVPHSAGYFPLTVTVSDAGGESRTSAFSLTVYDAEPLRMLTTTVPVGVAGSPYSTRFSATGGIGVQTFALAGGALPAGLRLSSDGALSGTPTVFGQFRFSVRVSDIEGNRDTGDYVLSLAVPPLVITGALSSATVGSAVEARFGATGGVAPYVFGVVGSIPSGTRFSNGVLSGTPNSPGTFQFTVGVTDSRGTVETKTFRTAVAMPPPPAMTLTSLPAEASPAAQPRFGVALNAPYLAPLTVTLTLKFTADSGSDDSAIQFATGGRTVDITIPAGATTAPSDISLQTGTVAGSIAIGARLSSLSTDITPSPAPLRTIHVKPDAPVISSVSGVRSAAGVTVTITGYANSRELTQALFRFADVSGANLQATPLTVATDSLLSQWYDCPAAAPFGGQFTLMLPLAIQGNPQSIRSVTVTLVSHAGNSSAVTTDLQ
jgi:hypothetical protein